MDAVADALYGRASARDRRLPQRELTRHDRALHNSPVAIVGVGAILPDAPDAAPSGTTSRDGRYSISDVDPERWDPALYYDADPQAPDKTYSKIGGWVRDCAWDPLAWQLPMPPQGRRRDGRRPEVGGRVHPRRRCSTPAGRSGRSTPSAPP